MDTNEDNALVAYLTEVYGIDEEDIRCMLEKFYDANDCPMCCMIDECSQIVEMEE